MEMKTNHHELTPRQIVGELDKHIVGQTEAKKVVAIALRNRARRRQLEDEMQEEVSPKNIIMIGPTGVGKTEIARRLSRLVQAPLVKVEATKYTEVGYVGRDVESMVRDLVETSMNMVREEMQEELRPQAAARVREQLLTILEPKPQRQPDPHAYSFERRVFLVGEQEPAQVVEEEEQPSPEHAIHTRQKLEKLYDQGLLDDREVTVEVTSRPGTDSMFGMIGIDEQQMSGLRDMMEKMMPTQRKTTTLTVAQARRVLMDEALEEMMDKEKVKRTALERAEQSGIIFIDEIDKIAGRQGGAGPDVSREGVQRDILPIVEGCTVNTKHGSLRTDHILFIAAGAFHMTKPSDLIPELQGRFPLRVELEALTTADLRRILTEPKCSLVKQYKALLATDGVELDFTEDAIDALAEAANHINSQAENIGARRLYSILERVLEQVAYDAPDVTEGRVQVDRAYVNERLGELMKNRDLSRFIL